MPDLKPVRRLAFLAALLPLGGCYYVASEPVAPTGTVYSQPRAGQYVGTTCAAGVYVCPVAPGPLGAQCSCPGLGAPSFGAIR